MDQFFGLDLTDEQKEYVDSIFNKQFTIVNAKSGTGKTMIAVGAARILNKKLIYIFAPVQEDKMGFRPGDQKEKELDYLGPLKHALLKINENPDQAIIDPTKTTQSDCAWVEPVSHIFQRGDTIEDATVIIDEAQNFTRGELKKVLTRITDSCTAIMIGHDGQCDLPYESQSGFVPYTQHFIGKDYVRCCSLNKNFRGQLAQDADEMRW